MQRRFCFRKGCQKIVAEPVCLVGRTTFISLRRDKVLRHTTGPIEQLRIG